MRKIIASGRRARIGIALALAAITAGAATLPAIAGNGGDSPATRFAVPADSRSFADVVEMVSPSVVGIAITKEAAPRPTASFPGAERGLPGSPFDEFFGRYFDMPGRTPQPGLPSQALGSGFFVDDGGYIVTNNHVIDGASNITVVLHDGKELQASLVGTDAKTDLALLKVDAGEIPPALGFGDSDRARVGDWVLAIGNPFGLGGSATAGIISARGRDIRSGPYDDYLQIDAPINSGNSGGPVFNAGGEVIGVNTAIYSPNGGNVGIGFAIPSKQVKTIVAELKTSGSVRRGWLGVQIQDLDEDLAASLGLQNAAGALVADVVADSPASKSGLMVGDVIVQFADEDVSSAKSLSIAVADTDPAGNVSVKVWRNGKQKTLQVKLGEAETDAAVVAGMNRSAPGMAGEALGLSLAALTESQRQQLDLPEQYSGVIVVDVQPGSDAAAKGIRPGDTISRIGQLEVASVGEAKAAIEKAKSAGKEAALLVRRGDGQQFVSVALS